MGMRMSFAALLFAAASAPAQQLPTPVGAVSSQSRHPDVVIGTVAESPLPFDRDTTQGAAVPSADSTRQQFKLQLHTSLDHPDNRTEEEKATVLRAVELLGCRSASEIEQVTNHFNDQLRTPAEQVGYLKSWIDANRADACAGGRIPGRLVSIGVVRLEDLPWYENRALWHKSGPDFRGARYFSGNGWMSEMPKGSGKWYPDADKLCKMVRDSRPGPSGVPADTTFDHYFIYDAHLNGAQLGQMKDWIEANACDPAKRGEFMRKIELSPRLMTSNLGPNGHSGHHIFNQTQRKGVAMVLDGNGLYLPFEQFLMDNCTNSGPAEQEVEVAFEKVEAPAPLPCDCKIAPAPAPQPVAAVVAAPVIGPRRHFPWLPVLAGVVIGGLVACATHVICPNGHLSKGGHEPGDVTPITRIEAPGLAPRFNQGLVPSDTRNYWIVVPAIRGSGSR